MLILVGKIGSGKTTVVKELVQNFGYEKAVTDTTRPKRPGEIEGVDYHFLTKEEFDKNKENGLYAETVTYNATFGEVSYGSKKSLYTLDESSSKRVIILNPFGLKSVLESGVVGSVSVYLKLSDDTIRERIKKRGDSTEELERRLITDREDFSDIEEICDFIIDIDAAESDEEKTVSYLAEFVDKVNSVYELFQEGK